MVTCVRAGALLALLALGACRPPEAERERGGGPGADVGNRGADVVLHEEQDPFLDTPRRSPDARPAAGGGR